MSGRTSVPSRSTTRAVLLICGMIAGVLALLVGPSPAAAQDATNSLRSIDPPDGATLAVSPEQIVLTFDQEVENDAGQAVSLQLACNSQPQATGIPEVDDDGLIVTVAVNAAVPRGACTITWLLADELGETIVSDFSTFSVTAEPPTSEAAGATTTTDPNIRVPVETSATTATDSVSEGSSGGALWLGRVLSTLGIMIIFGALALISVGWPEGPEYVVTVRFLRALWVLSLVGTVIYLIAFAADFNNSSFGAAVNPSAWLDLKDAGWPGRGALMRIVFVIGAGWVAFRPERIIDPTSAMWAWAVPALAVVSVALGRTDGPWAVIGVLIGIVHVLASAVWVGGAALVARVVLAGPGEEDLVQATRAFSRISMPAIVITCVTGIIQMIRLDGGDLFSTSHGQVLLLKVVAVAAMLAVSLAVNQQVSMRLDNAHEMTVPLADRFRRAFGAEAALGVVVLAFSGWMVGLTPAKVDPLAGQSYAVEVPFVDSASGIDATVSIGPARVGLNGLKVEVNAPEDGITNLSIRFVPPVDAEARIIQQTIPLQTSGTAVLDQAGGIPLDAAGNWTIQLSASTAIGVLENASTEFPVLNPDGSSPSIPEAPAPTSPVEVSVIDQSTVTAPFATTTTAAPTTTTTTVPDG